MEKEILEQKAKMLEEVMNDKSYVPMKAKELAMLLGIPKSQRDELTQDRKSTRLNSSHSRLSRMPSSA